MLDETDPTNMPTGEVDCTVKHWWSVLASFLAVALASDWSAAEPWEIRHRGSLDLELDVACP